MVKTSACAICHSDIHRIRGEWDGFHAEILDEPIRWEDGYIIPPTRPGLGVELNEEVAEQHRYTGKRLHLKMLDRPVA